jgi:hypothetical protein
MQLFRHTTHRPIPLRRRYRFHTPRRLSGPRHATYSSWSQSFSYEVSVILARMARSVKLARAFFGDLLSLQVPTERWRLGWTAHIASHIGRRMGTRGGCASNRNLCKKALRETCAIRTFVLSWNRTKVLGGYRDCSLLDRARPGHDHSAGCEHPARQHPIGPHANLGPA